MVFSRDEHKCVRDKCSKDVFILYFNKDVCVPNLCHKQRVNAFKSILSIINKSKEQPSPQGAGLVFELL